MLSIIKLFFGILILVFLSSCEEVVQINLEEGSKLYVIDAFINDSRETQVVKILHNDSYFSNRIAPPVTNATVILKDLTSNLQFNFSYTNNGRYEFPITSIDTIARINHTYELNVIIDGITYQSITIQKRAAVIDSIQVTSTNYGGIQINSSQKFCILWARDKADNNPDYYWVKTFRNDTLFTAASDINLSTDGTDGPVSDITFDTIDFTPPTVYLGSKGYYKGNTCKVEIHSITHETYNFFNQAINQILNNGLFATTPENVKTNIITPTNAKIKAVGWFSVASVAGKSIIIN